MRIVTRRDRIAHQIERLEEEYARLLALPNEPEVPDEEPNVIWFVKTFGTDRDYTYAAVKAGNGLWYTTGQTAPKGYTWDELINWIGPDCEVWHASEWEPWS